MLLCVLWRSTDELRGSSIAFASPHGSSFMCLRYRNFCFESAEDLSVRRCAVDLLQKSVSIRRSESGVERTFRVSQANLEAVLTD
mmetsp:Transcript_10050/g.20349  ORF Transcript_10050/g.20349 Transcript_10050/m.20349 type:complete len:85 (+) Transcript_10050:499-753(+)